jgi:hypothetical protein
VRTQPSPLQKRCQIGTSAHSIHEDLHALPELMLMSNKVTCQISFILITNWIRSKKNQNLMSCYRCEICVISQAVNSWNLANYFWIQSQWFPRGICSGQGTIWTSFSPRVSILICRSSFRLRSTLFFTTTKVFDKHITTISALNYGLIFDLTFG